MQAVKGAMNLPAASVHKKSICIGKQGAPPHNSPSQGTHVLVTELGQLHPMRRQAASPTKLTIERHVLVAELGPSALIVVGPQTVHSEAVPVHNKHGARVQRCERENRNLMKWLSQIQGQHHKLTMKCKHPCHTFKRNEAAGLVCIHSTITAAEFVQKLIHAFPWLFTV